MNRVGTQRLISNQGRRLPRSIVMAVLVTSLLLFPVVCLDDALPHSIFTEPAITPVLHDPYGAHVHDYRAEDLPLIDRSMLLVRSMPAVLTVALGNAAVLLDEIAIIDDSGDSMRVPERWESAGEDDAEVVAPPPRG